MYWRTAATQPTRSLPAELLNTAALELLAKSMKTACRAARSVGSVTNSSFSPSSKATAAAGAGQRRRRRGVKGTQYIHVQITGSRRHHIGRGGDFRGGAQIDDLRDPQGRDGRQIGGAERQDVGTIKNAAPHDPIVAGRIDRPGSPVGRRDPRDVAEIIDRRQNRRGNRLLRRCRCRRQAKHQGSSTQQTGLHRHPQCKRPGS